MSNHDPSSSTAAHSERSPLLQKLARSGQSSAEGSVRRNYTQELYDTDADVDSTGTPREARELTAEINGNGLSGRKDGAAEGPKSIKRRTSKLLPVARKIKQRSKYYVPVTGWLPKYNWTLFSGDFVAGVSVACLLIPQAISYANGLAKLNPVAGLWSAALPPLVYGVLGTCHQLSVGPESALCLLIGQMIQTLVLSDPDIKHPELEAAAIAIITTLQIGIITLALGLLRLGYLDVILSRALLRGFVTAVGVIILIEQLVPMLGMSQILRHPEANQDPPSTPLAKLIFVLRHLDHTNRTTAILAFSSLGILILARVVKQYVVQRPGGKWVRFVPEILLVVVGTTTLTGLLRWDAHGVEVLGKISAGAGNPFGWPITSRTMKYFNYTFSTSFVSAVVGIVDSVVAARENGSKYGYAVGPNRELVALGNANVLGGFLMASGAVPVFGSITRSRLNGVIGSRTQMASIITSLTIVLAIFFLLPSLYFLPKAVLASIILLVVYAILAEAPHEIKFLWQMQAWTDFLQMTGTFFLTLLFSIEVCLFYLQQFSVILFPGLTDAPENVLKLQTGLVASVVFSLILVVQQSTQTRIKIIGRLPDSDEWAPIDEDDAAQEEIPGVLVVRIRENLNFANTAQLKERLRRLELYGMQKSHPSDAPRRESAKAVILHMGDVEEIDASAIQILYDLTKAYAERGVGLHFAHLNPVHVRIFEIVGITAALPPNHFHRDLREAMREIESLGYGTSILSRY